MLFFRTRTSSRLLILPLTTENNNDLDIAAIDKALDRVGMALPTIVKLGEKVGSEQLHERVSVLQRDLLGELPSTDGIQRLTKSYAMVVALTEIVSIQMTQTLCPRYPLLYHKHPSHTVGFL